MDRLREAYRLWLWWIVFLEFVVTVAALFSKPHGIVNDLSVIVLLYELQCTWVHDSFTFLF